MQCYEPRELVFPSPKPSTFNEPISRIHASAYNSAAFNEHNNMYIWGSASDFKLGTNKILNVTAPM